MTDSPNFRRLIPRAGTHYLVTHETARQVLLNLQEDLDPGRVGAVLVVQVPGCELDLCISALYMLPDDTLVERWFAPRDLDWLASVVEGPIGAALPAQESALPGGVADNAALVDLTRMLLRFYVEDRARFRERCAATANKAAEARDHAQQALGLAQEARDLAAYKLGQLADQRHREQQVQREAAQKQEILLGEAHLAFRSSRGDTNRTYFLELLPRVMEFREVEPGLFRDWLVAFRKNPQVRAEDVARIRIRDTFLEQQARVEVEYQAAAASFSRYFTPGKIDSILQELLGAEAPACDLGSAVPFLSEESRWKLNRLWADKCSESFMPHELCNGLSIQPDEALRVMEALAAAGRGKMMQLAYHTCMEPPVKAVPAGTDLEFPFDCPECDGEITAESQLRFGHMLRKVAP